MPSSRNGNGYQYDRERVVTDDLAVVLERFVKAWLAERPRGENRRFGSIPIEMQFMGPIDYISEKTGIPHRRIAGIIARETYTTSYYMADLILTKINMGHHLDQLRSAPMIRRKFKNNEEWLEYLDSIGCRR